MQSARRFWSDFLDVRLWISAIIAAAIVAGVFGYLLRETLTGIVTITFLGLALLSWMFVLSWAIILVHEPLVEATKDNNRFLDSIRRVKTSILKDIGDVAPKASQGDEDSLEKLAHEVDAVYIADRLIKDVTHVRALRARAFLVLPPYLIAIVVIGALVSLVPQTLTNVIPAGAFTVMIAFLLWFAILAEYIPTTASWRDRVPELVDLDELQQKQAILGWAEK